MNHRVKVLVVNTANDNGSESANETDDHVRAQLVEVNKVYDKAGIEFVLDRVIGPVKDSSLARDPSGPDDEEAREKRAMQTPGHLVVFVRTRGNATKGALYSSLSGEHVVMQSGQSGAALAHELGHFFGLGHTHSADAVFGVGMLKYTNPDAKSPTIRPFAKRFAYLREQFEQRGLDEAQARALFDGDGGAVSDTPADPGPPLFEPTDKDAFECCGVPREVTLEWEAPKGTPRRLVLKPDKDNVMSYFFHCRGSIHLSDQQAAIVRAAIETGVRKRLRRGWMAWQSREGGVLKASPAAVCRKDGTLDVFGWGTDGRLWQNSFSASRWTGWTPHNDGLKLGAAPTAASMAADHIIVVALDEKRAVLSKEFHEASGWRPWKPREGGVLLASPAAYCREAGVLDVFGWGTDKRVWQNSLVNGRWTGWFVHKDGLEVGDAPTVTSRGRELVDLYAIDGGGAVRHRRWTAGKGWSAWSSGTGGVLAASPAASPRNPVDMHLFGHGTDDRLWRNSESLFSATGWEPHDDGLKLGDRPTVPSRRFDQRVPQRIDLFAIDSVGRAVHKVDVP